MGIDGLSPLQDWLERIHGNLERKEVLKARFAALVLPIFEAFAFLSIVRQLFFRSSANKSKDSQTDLLKKASFLAFNTFFSSYHGFKSPKKCYLSHQHWGLVKEFLADEIKIQEEAIIKPDSPKEVSKTNPEKEEELEVEYQLEAIVPLKENKAESQLVAQMAKPKTGWLHKIKVHSLIKQLQNTPNSLSKKSSFQLYRTAIVNKAHSLSVFTARTQKNLPSLIEKKNILSHSFPPERYPLKLLALFSPEGSEELGQEEGLKDPLEKKEDPKINSNEVAENQGERPPDERLIPIFDLISQTIPKKGSWKIKDQKIIFNQSKSFHFDPYIVDKLAKAHRDGLLSVLTFDQAMVFNQNLQIIDSYLTTKKSSQLGKMFAVTAATQNRLVELWVSQDNHGGRLYAKCGRLMTKIMNLIKEGKGQEDDESGKLFRKKYSLDFFDRFEEWQFGHLFPKYKTDVLELTLHDFYHFLKAYLQNLPEPILTSWRPLKETISLNELLAKIQQLSEIDQVFVTKLLTMLHCAYTHIWLGNLEAMLEEVPELTSLICPNSLKALLENFQLLPQG